MTRDEIVAIVKARLGNRGGTLQDVSIQNELKLVQETLEASEFLPWFLLSETADSSTTANEERIAVPVDFIREHEEGFLYLYDAALDNPWVALPKIDLEDARRDFPSTGRPKVYALTNKYFRLFPIPDKSYALKMMYYQHQPVLSSNITNDWTSWFSTYLVEKTFSQMARNFQMNLSKITAAEQLAAQAMAQLKLTHTQRALANRSLVMGDAL